jgi:arginyl-tRNA synthetase
MTEPPATQPNIFATVLSRVRHANAALAREGFVPQGLDYTRIVVEPPRDPTHGGMVEYRRGSTTVLD